MIEVVLTMAVLNAMATIHLARLTQRIARAAKQNAEEAQENARNAACNDAAMREITARAKRLDKLALALLEARKASAAC